MKLKKGIFKIYEGKANVEVKFTCISKGIKTTKEYRLWGEQEYILPEYLINFIKNCRNGDNARRPYGFIENEQKEEHI